MKMESHGCPIHIIICFVYFNKLEWYLNFEQQVTKSKLFYLFIKFYNQSRGIWVKTATQIFHKYWSVS